MGDVPVEMSQKLLPRVVSAGISLLFAFGTLVVMIKYVVPRMDPSRSEKERSKQRAAETLRRLRIDESKMQLDEYELCIAQDLVDPETMKNTWSDVGGLTDVIQQLKETVIWPLRYSTVNNGRASRICRPPKGVLLYGPPGCGKTLLARVTARESGARFINLQTSSLVDKWYGESQKRTAALFTLARKIAPCIIFIDEIDSFLRSRSREDHEATAIMKTQFMTFWDGLQAGAADAGAGGIVIIGATNRLADIDEAILRRMPTRLYVAPPDTEMRHSILQVLLRDENVAPDVIENIEDFAKRCDSFSGSDLLELCRQAAMNRLRWHYSRLEDRRLGLLKHNGGASQLADLENEAGNLADFQITRADFESALSKVRATKRSMAVAQASRQSRSSSDDLANRLVQLLGSMQDVMATRNSNSEFSDANENSHSNEVEPD